ncbi:hypothetical protein [Yersinia phage fHe-Yen9-03]|uniref:HNH endonuclease n=1 Tax=Yersinia phage fHe-Yen9-03 TaxID=2052743 RepID=A0A2C9D1V5_9CAUD|nr:hypothetical protein [Yersinia phage fHe-Yen9-03]
MINVKNVKFKPSYVMNFDTNVNGVKMSKNVQKVVAVMKRDGVKCHCCENESVFFEIIDKNQMAAFIDKNGKKIRLTLDHDKLDSLGGQNIIKNFHVLCEECNMIRGDSFAEYGAFKEWYDEKKKSGKKINKSKHYNYNRIDFDHNVKYHFDTILFENGIPNPMKQKIINVFKTKNTLSGIYALKVMRKVGKEHLNKFLSELIYSTVAERLNIKPITNQKVFNLFPKNESLISTQFFANLNSNMKNQLAQVTKEYQNNSVQKEVIEIHNNSTSLWTRLYTALRSIIS